MLRLVESPLDALGKWHDKLTWEPHDQSVEQYLKDATKGYLESQILTHDALALSISDDLLQLRNCPQRSPTVSQAIYHSAS